MRRVACLFILFCALLPAASALAQSNPFTPPTPPIQTAVPTATPVPKNNPDNTFKDEEPRRGLLFGIAGIVAFLFVGIGVYITRDARKNLTDADRRAVDRQLAGLPPEDLTAEQKRQQKKIKERARKKGKAQRQARKAQRPKR